MSGFNSHKILNPLKLIVFLAAFSLFAVSGVAEEASRYTLCKLDKEVRTLRVEKESGKCLTTYTKYGKDQNIGEALNPASCDDVLSRVKDTLVKAGWKCRDVQNASVSELKPEIQ